MIEIMQLALGPLQTNCYIVGCEETMAAAVVDPSWDGKEIAAAAVERGYDITHILLTHSHFDHVGGLAELKAEMNVPIYIHPEALPMLEQATMNAAFFNVRILAPPQPEELLQEGQIIAVGNLRLQVLFTPGHAPGHVCFYIADHHVLLDGDVLFQQSIGHTDLPGGDYELLIRNIREKVMVLPDETHVLSGHGPATTIGRERQWNPFLRQ